MTPTRAHFRKELILGNVQSRSLIINHFQEELMLNVTKLRYLFITVERVRFKEDYVGKVPQYTQEYHVHTRENWFWRAFNQPALSKRESFQGQVMIGRCE